MKNLLSLIVIFFSISTYAVNYTDMAIEAGIRSQNGDVSGQDTSATIGYQFGVSTAIPIADKWSVRTGFLYTEKNVEVKLPTGKDDYKYTYVEIPAAIMMKFTDYAGAYAGVNLSFNLDDDCAGGSCPDTESFITPIIIGAAFKFAPQMGANLYYETIPGDVSEGVDNFRAVGANLMITFE